MNAIPYLIIAVIACNIAVVAIATRNAAQRQKAIQQAPNVYPFYQRLDIRA